MGKKIVVFGSYVVDLTGRTPRLPVAGETVKGTSFKLGPGGKGSNQAVACKRAGGDVTMVTKLGDDTFGRFALDFYKNEGMNTDYIIIDKEKETGCALICVDEVTGQNQIVVISGSCANINDDDIAGARELIESADIMLTQLEINFDALYKGIDIAYEKGVRIIMNTAPAAELPDEVYKKLWLVTPNETEAQFLTGITVDGPESASKAARVLLDKGVKNVIITLGSMGAYVTDGVKEEMIPSIKVDVIDTTGAGDAFNGGLAKALADGLDLFTAARYANVTGALSVTKIGTAPAMPQQEEIEKSFKENYG